MTRRTCRTWLTVPDSSRARIVQDMEDVQDTQDTADNSVDGC